MRFQGRPSESLCTKVESVRHAATIHYVRIPKGTEGNTSPAGTGRVPARESALQGRDSTSPERQRDASEVTAARSTITSTNRDGVSACCASEFFGEFSGEITDCRARRLASWVHSGYGDQKEGKDRTMLHIIGTGSRTSKRSGTAPKRAISAAATELRRARAMAVPCTTATVQISSGETIMKVRFPLRWSRFPPNSLRFPASICRRAARLPGFFRRCRLV